MPRKKKYSIPIQLVELEQENFHILIETTFGDQHSVKWAIDTGASKTVFDINRKEYYELAQIQPEEIQSAGISESQIETKAGQLNTMLLADMEFTDIEVALIDLQHVNNLYQQFTDETLVGLIGSDFLVKHQAIIDYKKLTLTLYQ